MIKDKSTRIAGVEIDLTGPEGNAFTLMGYAKSFGRQMDMSSEEIEDMLTDMQSADYEHLLEVFEDHFGHVVTLWR